MAQGAAAPRSASTTLRRALWLGFALFALAVSARVVQGTAALLAAPFQGFAMLADGTVNPSSLKAFAGGAAGVQGWTRVRAVCGTPVDSAAAVRAHLRAHPADAHDYVFTRTGDGPTTTARVPTTRLQGVDVLRTHLVQVPLGILFLLLSFAVSLARPTPLVGAAFLASFGTLGLMLLASTDFTLLWGLPPLFHPLGAALGPLGLLLVGALCRREHTIEPWSRPERAIFALVSFMALTLSVAFLTLVDGVAAYRALDRVFYGFLFACILLGAARLRVASKHHEDAVVRARVRRLQWGWPLSLATPVLAQVAEPFIVAEGTSAIWNLALLGVPLSTMEAIATRDLLEIGRPARRLAGEALAAALFGGLLSLGLSLAHTRFGMQGPPLIVLSVATAMLALPLATRWYEHLERGGYDAAKLSAELVERVRLTTNVPALRAALADVLDRSLRPRRLELVRVAAAEELRALEGPGRVVVPLELGGRAMGAMVLEPGGGRALSAFDLGFLTQLAAPLAAAFTQAAAFEELEERVAARTRELAQKNEELRSLDARKDEMVAAVSHDFRSPLAVIRQNVQTLQRDHRTMDLADRTAFLDAIARQERRLSTMAEQLLDLQRLRARGLERRPLDVVEACAEIVAVAQDRAKAKAVAVRLDAPRGALSVLGDRARLAQAVSNLVDNAVRFSTEGHEVVVRCAARGDQVVVEVVDTGPGIEEAALSRLFEPFFQGDAGRARADGSGLGLAIVRAVARAHGGDVDVTSRPGAGATFSLRLPLPA